MKILSIIIPTYNRKDAIQNQVRSLLPQLTDSVSLIVIDNKSEYDINALFTNEEKSKFSIIVNKRNIGGAANIAKCFEICQTKWLWTLSDDDYVVNNAVNIVLEDIKNNPEVCYFNYNNNHSFKDCNIENSVKKIRHYQDFYYMSICLYNVELLAGYLHHYNRALSTMQPGVYMLIKYLENNNGSLLISDKKIIDGGSSEISWNRITFVYASLYLLDLLKWDAYKYSDNIFHFITGDCMYCIYTSIGNGINKKKALSVIKDVIKRRGVLRMLRFDMKYFIYYTFKIILKK